MSKMRKCTTFLNKELLDKGTKKGIHFVAGVERTACRCGYVSSGRIYECPSCGNADFMYDINYHGKVSEGEYQLELNGNDLFVFNYGVFLFWDSNIYLQEEKCMIIEWKGGNLSLINCNIDFRNKVLSLLLEHIDELPIQIRNAVRQLQRFKLQTYNVFERLVNPGPNLKALIKNEEGKDTEFLLESINRFAGTYRNTLTDVPFDSFEKCCKIYRIPEEFHSILRKKTIDVFYMIKTHMVIPFELSKNWHLVTPEVKNIALYYYENGIINFMTYISLGDIHQSIVSNTDLLSPFLKRYMMQYKDNIVSVINNVCNYLIINKIPIDNNTLDLKYYNQRRNIDIMKGLIARSDYDIDNFVNGLGASAVDAIKNLANAKKVAK